MAGQAGPSIPAPILRVRERFENWRRTKLGRERIPERLWIAAIRLCNRDWSVRRIARWLRLNDSALRDQVKQSSRPERGPRARKESAPAFVEWVSTAPASPGAEYVLELQDGGDLRIRVRGAGVHEVAALAKLVREDRS